MYKFQKGFLILASVYAMFNEKCSLFLQYFIKSFVRFNPLKERKH